jgi:hypothetical protein
VRGDDARIAAGCLMLMFAVGLLVGRFGLRPGPPAEAERGRLMAELYKAQHELLDARAEADQLRRAKTDRADPAGGETIRPIDPPLPVE